MHTDVQNVTWLIMLRNSVRWHTADVEYINSMSAVAELIT